MSPDLPPLEKPCERCSGTGQEPEGKFPGQACRDCGYIGTTPTEIGEALIGFIEEYFGIDRIR